MKDRIFELVKPANSLSEVRDAVIRAFEEARVTKIGYVSGIITSEGPEHIAKNIEILAKHTETLRGQHDFPIFSATDVFNNEVFDRINASQIPYQHWLDFWREVLSTGHVTDVFMTPRWEISTGAKDEYETAQKLGLQIHHFNSAQVS